MFYLETIVTLEEADKSLWEQREAIAVITKINANPLPPPPDLSS